jgi:hypothetical protein
MAEVQGDYMAEVAYKASGSRHELNAMPSEGLFAERFMELCQDWFAPLYRRVSEPLWNNGIYANVRRAYYTCRFDVGVAEYYVPTVLNGEGFMQCHRIVVMVLPELDKDRYEGEIVRLISPLSEPLGIIDSTTIFVVAPKVTRQHAFKVWKEKFKAMLKIKRIAGCFAIPIVSSAPEVAFKKLLGHLKNFWEKRVKAFLDKLKIQPWQYSYKIKNILSSTLKVIENYDSQIIYCLKSMVAHLTYFEDGFKEMIKTIAGINLAKEFTEVLKSLKPAMQAKVIVELQECLQATHLKFRVTSS